MNSFNHIIGHFLAMSGLYLRLTENDITFEITSNEFEELNETVDILSKFYNSSDQSLI